MIVRVGLNPPADANTDPSARNTFSTSWRRPNRSLTELAASRPIRAVPMMWAVEYGPLTSSPRGAGAASGASRVAELTEPDAASQIAASFGA